MAGKLYVVGTPIGNLGDMTPRAIDTLRQADFIAAEDTRVTIKLLNHFDIKAPMVSTHEHNEAARSGQIVTRLLSGESCALVTDAGMPCISDPGGRVVAAAAEAGIEVVSVPGPSAVIAALSLSGLESGRFCFEGFLPVAKAERRAHLASVAGETRTLVFYEAPHKLRSTLSDLLTALGDRPIALCREMTKRHEEVIRTTVSEAVAFYSETDPRGEYVLVVAGAEPVAAEAATFEEALSQARALMAAGSPPTEAAKRAAKATGQPRSAIYKALTE